MMRIGGHWVVFCLAAVLVACSSPRASAQTPKYAALFTDGTYVREGRLTDGHAPALQPKIEGRLLDDPQKPARWVRNTSLPPGTLPRAFVEFVGGDRIAGEILGYRSGEEKPNDREFPHFLLSLGDPRAALGEPRPAGEPPGSPRRPPGEPGLTAAGEMPVLARWVRRIVWQPTGGDRYQPGTLIYRDGRQAAVRRVRFIADRVLALLDDGPKEIALAELAELHFPRSDPWDAYFEQLAMLAADETTRLVTLQSDDGQLMTTTTDRFQPRHHGNANDPNNWDFLVQPAWSLRPFWISHARVHTRVYFAPHEVPLSAIEPLKIEQRSTSGTRFLPCVDRNVRGQFLQTGARGFAWGLGTHASCAITFPLPEGARALRSFVGLDEIAGRGGCARARVFAGATDGKPLYESKLLVGSNDTVDTGRIDLAGVTGGEKKLVLVSDAAHRDRPAGADPLDIRDFVDWLEPILELDPEKLRSELAQRAATVVPAWEGWSVRRQSGEPVFASRWDPSDPRNRRHVVEIVASGEPLTISSRQRITADHDYLLIAARQTKNGPTVRLSVRIAETPAGEFDVLAPNDRSVSPPIFVSVANFRGREVPIELNLTSRGDTSRVRFGALRLVGEPNKNEWTTLRPKRVKSAEGTVLVIQPDGSILASGPRPPQDRFTIEAQTNVNGITAIRLEALADPVLEHLGPGRGPNGNFMLTDFRLTAAPVGRATEAQVVPLAHCSSDYSQASHPAAHVIDDDRTSGWSIGGATGQAHVAVFETRKNVGHAAGTLLTFQLEHRYGQSQTLGRFRLSATTDPRPVRAAEGGIIQSPTPSGRGGLKVILDDERQFIDAFTEGRPNTRVETKDKFSRALCLRVKPGEAGGAKLVGVNLPIRAQPAAGEFRYLRFAWRKQGGSRIALALANDGKWEATPPGGGQPRKLVYFAGPPGGLFPDEAISVHEPTPTEWVVVTRDLLVDFGPITLTGMMFHCPDGQNALFDHIQVAQSLEQFEPPSR